MTPDQLRHEETRAWLDRARRDLRAARLLTAGDANAEALFHCQPAVEKALKALLTFHERTFRKAQDGLQRAEAVVLEVERRLPAGESDGGQ